MLTADAFPGRIQRRIAASFLVHASTSGEARSALGADRAEFPLRMKSRARRGKGKRKEVRQGSGRRPSTGRRLSRPLTLDRGRFSPSIFSKIVALQMHPKCLKRHLIGVRKLDAMASRSNPHRLTIRQGVLDDDFCPFSEVSTLDRGNAQSLEWRQVSGWSTSLFNHLARAFLPSFKLSALLSDPL